MLAEEQQIVHFTKVVLGNVAPNNCLFIPALKELQIFFVNATKRLWDVSGNATNYLGNVTNGLRLRYKTSWHEIKGILILRPLGLICCAARGP